MSSENAVFPPEFEDTGMRDKDGQPVYRHNRDFFGYQGFCCERTIASDSVPMLRELIKRGYVTKETRCIDNATLVEYARRRGARACEAALRLDGWPG